MNGNLSGNLQSIEYVGLPGISQSCVDAVLRLVQFGNRIELAWLLSCSPERYERVHCLLLHVVPEQLVAVRSGFSSGYGGEGPRALSFVLALLNLHKIRIEEYQVAADLIKRLDSASLRVEDLETLSRGRPVLPTRWYDYVWDSHWEQGLGDLWTSLPPIIPLAIVDSRIADLALGFLEHPDEKLMTGYRRLEDIIRKRTGIDEHGARLFSEAFQGKERKLAWKGLAPSESDGRALLFRAVYMAFRNPRAHRELDNPDQAHISEFMLLNQLFLLERQATLTGS